MWSRAKCKANKSYKRSRYLVKVNFTTIYDLTSSSLTMSALQKFGLQVAKYAAAATPFPNCSGSYLRVEILFSNLIQYPKKKKITIYKKASNWSCSGSLDLHHNMHPTTSWRFWQYVYTVNKALRYQPSPVVELFWEPVCNQTKVHFRNSIRNKLQNIRQGKILHNNHVLTLAKSTGGHKCTRRRRPE